MTYLLLLLLLAVFTAIFFFLFKKDILSPTVITGLAFMMCVALAIMGLFSWNDVSSLSLTTILIVSAGYLSFGLGEFVIRKRLKIGEVRGGKGLKKIDIKKWKIIAATTIGIATGFLLVMEIYRICNHYSYSPSSLPDALSFYRTKIGLFSTDLRTDGTDIAFVVKQLKKICDVLCVIFMFLFVNNAFAGEKKKKLIAQAIPIIIFLSLTLLTSGRSLLMHLCVALIMIAITLYRAGKDDKKINLKIAAAVGSSVVVIFGIFYAILPLVGRSTSHGFGEYMSFYLGTPIPSLQKYLDNPNAEKKKFGEETFSGIYYTLDRFGLMDNKKADTHEWVHFKKNFSSNVYTSFRRYYHDFGMAGVIIFQFIAGTLIALLYCFSLRERGKRKYLISIIFFFFAYMLVDQIRDEQFFSSISSATLTYIAIITVCYFMIVDDGALQRLLRRTNEGK